MSHVLAGAECLVPTGARPLGSTKDSNKSIVIAGSSNGFGYPSAVAFAKQGCRVWATMRNADGSNRQRKELLEATEGDIRGLDMVVGEDASVDAAIA